MDGGGGDVTWPGENTAQNGDLGGFGNLQLI